MILKPESRLKMSLKESSKQTDVRASGDAKVAEAKAWDEDKEHYFRCLYLIESGINANNPLQFVIGLFENVNKLDFPEPIKSMVTDFLGLNFGDMKKVVNIIPEKIKFEFKLEPEDSISNHDLGSDQEDIFRRFGVTIQEYNDLENWVENQNSTQEKSEEIPFDYFEYMTIVYEDDDQNSDQDNQTSDDDCDNTNKERPKEKYGLIGRVYENIYAGLQQAITKFLNPGDRDHIHNLALVMHDFLLSYGVISECWCCDNCQHIRRNKRCASYGTRRCYSYKNHQNPFKYFDLESEEPVGELVSY